MSLSVFPYRQKTFALDDLAGMTDAMHEDGFALIPGVLSPAEVQSVRDAIDRLQPFGFDSIGNTDHFKCVFNREKVFLDLIDRPGVIELAEATMGNQCHIIGETAWRSYPGHNGWGPHIDRMLLEYPENITDLDPNWRMPIYVCTAHYYLDDITEDLCPTYVIPGSHKSGRGIRAEDGPNPEWRGRKLEPVLCKAGDVLFFRSDVWHTGSKNESDRTRYLLQVHYSHRFIAPQFSPFLTFQFAPHILASANPRQRRLLGEHSKGAYD